MIEIDIKSLKIGESYKRDVIDLNGTVIIPASTKITQGLIEWLGSRNSAIFYTEIPVHQAEKDLVEADKLIKESQKLQKLHFLDMPGFQKTYKNVDAIQNPKVWPNAAWKRDNTIVRSLDSRLSYYPDLDKPTGDRLDNSAFPAPEIRSSLYKSSFVKYYSESLEDLKSIIDKIAQGLITNAGAVKTLADKLIEYFLKDKNLMFNFAYAKSMFSENLYHHSLNVGILAINMAASAGYSYLQVLEVGMGALLHDLGMIFIPQKIRTKQSGLSAQELAIIRSHPVDGLFLVAKIQGLPESTRYIIYQHHEREDGSGYPNGRTRTKTHRYARIVSFADIFEAMTDSRPYRNAFIPYDAIRQMLNDVSNRKLSPEIMKFFLNYGSIFPIGSYVRLNDNRLGKVVDARGCEYLKPLVAIIQPNKKGADSNNNLIDLSVEDKYSIVDVVSPYKLPNAALLEGF